MSHLHSPLALVFLPSFLHSINTNQVSTCPQGLVLGAGVQAEKTHSPGPQGVKTRQGYRYVTAKRQVAERAPCLHQLPPLPGRGRPLTWSCWGSGKSGNMGKCAECQGHHQSVKKEMILPMFADFVETCRRLTGISP